MAVLAVTVIALLVLVSGCGGTGSSSTGTTASAELRSRRDAFVAFYQAFLAALPARKASVEATARLQRAEAAGHAHEARAIGQTLGALARDAEAWRRTLEALPAPNSDLVPIRKRLSLGAATEAEYWRRYYSFFLASLAAGRASKEKAARVEQTKARLQAVNNQALEEMNTLTERLGGEAAFHGRINPKRPEEILSSLARQAAK
jgi:hypothetical protein